MTITDIAEKQAEERKREKRLVHLTNSLSHDFIETLKIKDESEKRSDEYVIKSFLDYVFFAEHKEIGEVSETLLRNFFLKYAAEKLAVEKERQKNMPELISKFCSFLDEQHFIRNAAPLIEAVKVIGKDFQKIKLATPLAAAEKKSAKPKKEALKQSESTRAAAVGRNDPCPCGSGKKYKKCCGKTS